MPAVTQYTMRSNLEAVKPLGPEHDIVPICPCTNLALSVTRAIYKRRNCIHAQATHVRNVRNGSSL